MSGGSARSTAPFGRAIKRFPIPTVRLLVAAGLGVVATGTFRPTGGRYDVGGLRKRPLRALRGGPSPMVASFALEGGSVAISIFAQAGACSDDETSWAMDRARAMGALDDDPGEFLALAQGHPLLAELAAKFDCRLEQTPTVFEAFARAVIEQLVTTFEAKASIRRLFADAGELVPGTFLRAAPTAPAVLGVPPWKLHAMGIGSRRSRTLREGARRGAALERLRTLDPALAATKLESLPGVGPWTANYVARLALGWTDAVPVGDFHAPYLISEALTGVQGGDEAMLDALAPFRPHRARVVQLVMQAMVADELPGYERTRRRLPRVDPHRREPWKY